MGPGQTSPVKDGRRPRCRPWALAQLRGPTLALLEGMMDRGFRPRRSSSSGLCRSTAALPSQSTRCGEARSARLPGRLGLRLLYEWVGSLIAICVLLPAGVLLCERCPLRGGPHCLTWENSIFAANEIIVLTEEGRASRRPQRERSVSRCAPSPCPAPPAPPMHPGEALTVCAWTDWWRVPRLSLRLQVSL